MPETSSSASSSSSCMSCGSFDEVPAAGPPGPRATTDIKLLCSYGGKILPRGHDGKRRYVGGHTRALTVQRHLSFRGLYQKLRELCGWDAVSVRCQLPTEDLDALVSVTDDDDLANVLDEYDVAAARQDQPQLRIRVFLLPPAGARKPRTPPCATPVTRQLATGRRRPGRLLMHGNRSAGSDRAGRRFVMVTPLVSGSPVRPELLCQ